MLSVKIELLPGGHDAGGKTIATARLGRIKNGPLCAYQVVLEDSVLGEVGGGKVGDYPRFATTIWDLVARAIAVSLTGNEELPPRPNVVSVQRRESDGIPYVRISDIPEPAKTFFTRNIAYSTCPFVSEEPDPMGCAYWWDFDDFLSGRR
ncbi:hypothetical protein PQR33_05745 [Paraburkholderia sediminicola]|uniref:hypothetical protein n=1 Tax=Paraburkholderia sediminicola TaxID=458836 RepID=UPI0038BDCDB4